MAGNVAEWVNDYYGASGSLGVERDPLGPEAASLESFAARAGRTERLPNCVYRFEILVKSRVTMLVSASRVISKTNRSWQTPIHGSI
jgi:formylglycine-generating enzyme required for sulfatase activity